MLLLADVAGVGPPGRGEGGGRLPGLVSIGTGILGENTVLSGEVSLENTVLSGEGSLQIPCFLEK